MFKSKQYLLLLSVIFLWQIMAEFTCGQRLFNPGLRLNRKVDTIPLQNRVQEQPEIFEAESLSQTVTIGRVVAQDMRQFGKWSDNKQILWVDNRPGHRMQLTFNAKDTGPASVDVFMTKAADFGDVDIGFDGRKLATHVGYSQTVVRSRVSLGVINLKAGANTLILSVSGKQQSSTGYRVGVDGIQVVSKRVGQRKPPGNKENSGQLPKSPIPIPDRDWGSTTDSIANLPSDMDSKSPMHPGDLEVKFPTGADLYVEDGEFISREPQQVTRYTMQLTYDVSKVPNANAVILQTVRHRFSTEVDAGGIPNLKPLFLEQSSLLPGKFGRYGFDTRLLPKVYPEQGPEYSVRIIPVSSSTSPHPVGKASNIIEVYSRTKVPGPVLGLKRIFHANRFADLVEQKISQKVSGYGLSVIPFNGPAVNRGKGIARSDIDGAPRAMSAFDRVNVASVTKFAVAIAMVKAIDSNPTVDLDSEISSYLPTDWKLGPNVETITFGELLGHRSGLRKWDGLGIDDASLKQLIAVGVPDLKLKTESQYLNHNFALIRLLLPRIKFIQGTGNNGDKLLRDVNASVLTPAGIDWASSEPGPGTALSHTFPAAKIKGRNWSAKGSEFGSSGLHISAVEMATLMHQFARTENVIRAELRDAMIQEQLGGSSIVDAGGRGFAKGGYLRSRKTDEVGSNPGNRAEQNTLVVVFSDGSVVGLVVNSSFADAVNKPPSFLPILIECFNESYSAF